MFSLRLRLVNITNAGTGEGPTEEEDGHHDQGGRGLSDMSDDPAVGAGGRELTEHERGLLAPSVLHLNVVLRHKLEEVIMARPKALERAIPSDLADCRIWQMVEL